jgi:hypothetical protein
MRSGWRPPSDELVEWEQVAASRPCPCCGATAGCSVAPALGYVRCRQVCSPRPFQGGGWLHLVGSDLPAAAVAGGPADAEPTLTPR